MIAARDRPGDQRRVRWGDRQGHRREVLGRRSRRRHGAWAAATLVCVAAVPLGAWLADSPTGDRLLRGQPPRQLDSGQGCPAEEPACTRLAEVLGVAHNAGDRHDTARRARAHGAEVVEIDVVSVGGRLRVGHDPPVPVLGEALYRGATLARAWRDAGPGGVLLDLKQAVPDVTGLAYAVGAQQVRAGRVLVTSPYPWLTARLAVELPRGTGVLLTVADPPALHLLRRDPAAAGPLAGISIQQRLVDTEVLRWARAWNWFVLVWTVNDLRRAQQLAVAGVDAIVTDDLALLRMMRGPHDVRSAPEHPGSVRRGPGMCGIDAREW